MIQKDRERFIQEYPAAAKWLKVMPEEVLQRCKLLFVRKNQSAFYSDDLLDYIYIVCKGTFMITMNSDSGNEMSVVYVLAGETLGEMEAIEGVKQFQFTALAYRHEGVLLGVPSKIFSKWIHEDVKVSILMVQMLAKKLKNSSNTTVQYHHLSSDVRLIMLFINLYGVGEISETRKDLAKACGMNERTINRVIKRLSQEGLVTVKRGKVNISEKQLKQMKENLGGEVSEKNYYGL